VLINAGRADVDRDAFTRMDIGERDQLLMR
jgi:hypothetical protein